MKRPVFHLAAVLMRSAVPILTLMIGLGAVPGLPAQRLMPEQSLEVVLEKRANSGWAVVEPGLVLGQGDEVRFRVKSSVDGHLYVFNRGPGGKSQMIFPAAQVGAENRIFAGKEFQLPSSDGAFAISGPPGYEVIRWVVANSELTADQLETWMTASSGRQPPVPPRLQPSCDESVLRARNLCMDGFAGAGEAELGESAEGLRPRSLDIRSDARAAVITATPSRDGVVVFEYRIAHQ